MDGDYQTWHLHYKVKLSSGLIYSWSPFFNAENKNVSFDSFYLSGGDVRDG